MMSGLVGCGKCSQCSNDEKLFGGDHENQETESTSRQ